MIEQDEEKVEVLNIRNMRSSDVTKYVDCDYWLGAVDAEGLPIEDQGQWVPHTILKEDPRFDRAITEFGAIETVPPVRDISSRLEEALEKGVAWNGVRLNTSSVNERDRILSTATRMSLNDTLPKGKESLGYMTADNGYTFIPKAEVVAVAMLIQDYIEDCHDNYIRLISDPTLDQYSGWPD